MKTFSLPIGACLRPLPSNDPHRVPRLGACQGVPISTADIAGDALLWDELPWSVFFWAFLRKNTMVGVLF